MLIRIALVCLALSMTLLSACATYKAQPYSVSAQNARELQQSGLSAHKIALAEFTSVKSGLKSINCRSAGPVETPDGKPFAEFIQAALKDELTWVGIYDPSAAKKLQGNLLEIDFNTSNKASWSIKMEFTPQDGSPFTVESVYPFEGAFSADKVCANTGNAFTPAVQAFLGKVFADKRFIEYVRN